MTAEEEIAQLKKELADEQAGKAQLRQQLEEALARLSELEEDGRTTRTCRAQLAVGSQPR